MQNIGSPDLLALFTGTMSHKMLELAAGQAGKRGISIVRSHIPAPWLPCAASWRPTPGPPVCEELLAERCAPTMAGLKTGSLFPCPKEDRAELLAGIRALNARLVPKGLRILPVKTVGDRELLSLYRPARLRRESDFPPEVGLFLGYLPGMWRASSGKRPAAPSVRGPGRSTATRKPPGRAASSPWALHGTNRGRALTAVAISPVWGYT